MFDTNDLLTTIKRASIDAIKNTNPVNICFGVVKSTSPLEVSIENKLTLTKDHITTPKTLSNYNVSIKIDGASKNITIYNALKSGEKVILLRVQGGQKYLILDRVI